MKPQLLFSLCMVAAFTARAQIEILGTLGSGNLPVTCYEGTAVSAFNLANLNMVEPGESAQVSWVQPGQTDPVTGNPLVRPGTNGPALVVGDFTGVKGLGAAVVVTVNVTGPDEALVVWLAPVIQDPLDHADQQKPSIWSQLSDASSQALPCSGFQVNSASRDRWQPVSGTPDVYYRPWFPSIIPIPAGYEGQQLYLTLATLDCLLNAHFSYSALQLYHIRLAIDVAEDPCTGGHILTAPPGAWAYNWVCDAGGGPWEGEAITTTMSGTFTVVMQTPSGCEYEMSVDVPAAKELPVIGEVSVGGELDCTTPGVELKAPKMDNVAAYTWMMKGSNEVLGTEEKLIARAKGTYVLAITSTLGSGCDVVREATVNAKMNLAVPEFTASAVDICAGDSVRFEVVTPLSAVEGKAEEHWDYGNGTTGSKSAPRAYDMPGVVTIDRAFTLGTCEEHFTQTVTVHPLPRPRMRVITHCGPTRGQRSFEFVAAGIGPSPSSVAFTLTASDGRAWPMRRDGMSIMASVPGDSTVAIHIEVVDALGCFGSHDTTWTAPFDPVADFRWKRIPPPGAYQLAINDLSTHHVQQQWQADSALITMDAAGRATLFDYAAPGEYSFTLTVTGAEHTCPDRLTGSEVLRMPHFEKLLGSAFRWPEPFERLTPIR